MSSPAPAAGLREKFMVLQCYTIIELGLKNSLPVSPQRFQIGVLRHDGKKQKCLGYQSAANFTEKSLETSKRFHACPASHLFHDGLESEPNANLIHKWLV